MSAYVLEKENIDFLTLATNAALELNNKYCASYVLHKDTIELFGKYRGDLHNIYRALYITNIKAVNGRYNEDTKTFPKYTELYPWDTSRLSINNVKKAIELFESYCYQIAEDPIRNGPIYIAIYDIYKMLCCYYIEHTMHD